MSDYEKKSFSFSYPISEVRKALNNIFETKNDYSWSNYESTLLLGLDLHCDLEERDGFTTILLSASESITLGFYKPGQKKKAVTKPKKVLTKK